MATDRERQFRIVRILKEDEHGLYVVDNYGNVQRPDKERGLYPGSKLCKAKKGDRLKFKFSHCGFSSQGWANDGSHWDTSGTRW